MIFLLTQWRWLLPTALLAISLAWGGWNHVALTNLRAANARATLAATEAARAADARYAALATQIEVVHHERSQAIDEAADTARDLARTRGMFVRGKSACVPKLTAGPGGNTERPIETQLSDRDADFLITFARDCARDHGVAVTARDWATSLKGIHP